MIRETSFQSELSTAIKKHQDKQTELENNIQELFEQKDKAENSLREKNEILFLLQGMYLFFDFLKKFIHLFIFYCAVRFFFHTLFTLI